MRDLSPILISETPLATVTRVMLVVESTIHVRRELFDGKHVGSVLIFPDAHTALRRALAAARDGTRGEWSAPTRLGSIAFIVPGPDRLLLEPRRLDGTPHGKPSELREPELERLREAHCIALYNAAGN